MSDEGNPRPAWEAAIAQRLVGSTVIIGMTYLKADGSVGSQEQMFGTIEIADRERGVAILLERSRSGELYWLPPDLRAYREAPKGSYRLRRTGEIIEDPDFTVSFTSQPAP